MAMRIGQRPAAAGAGCWTFLFLTYLCMPPGLASQDQPPATSDAAQGMPAVKREISLEDRADIFMARKAYADAIDYYRRALKQAGSAEARVWNKLGIAYQQEGNYRAARKAYKEALRRREAFPEAWNNIGTTYFLENKFSKSIKYYRRSLQVDPRSASVHLNLGTAYYYRKKYPEAMEAYRQALQLNPQVLTEQSTLGTVVRPALTERTHHSDARYYFYLAKVFAQLGRPEEATRNLRRALEDGFQDLNRIREDPDLKPINQFPAFIELLDNPPVPIK